MYGVKNIILFLVYEQQGKVLKTLKKLNKKLKQQAMEVYEMSQAIDSMKTEVEELIATVAANGNVVQSAVLAIQGLTDQQVTLNQQLQDALAAMGEVDPAVQAAADALDAQATLIAAQTAALAAAIPAGTPVEPPVEPPVE